MHYRLEQVTQALDQAPDLATTIDLEVPQLVIEVFPIFRGGGKRPACALFRTRLVMVLLCHVQALRRVLEHTLQHPPSNGAWLQPLNRLSVRLWEATGEAVGSSVDDPFAAWTRLQTYKGSDLKVRQHTPTTLHTQHSLMSDACRIKPWGAWNLIGICCAVV